MLQAQICPVCNGSGKIMSEPTTNKDKTCHGCDGRGWVEVGTPAYLPAYPNYPWEYPPYFYVIYGSSYSC